MLAEKETFCKANIGALMRKCRANHENTNQNDTNDGSVDKPVETPAGEDVTTEVENEPEYIQTPEEAQNFLMRLLNHVIDFIVRLFKK